MGDSLSILYVNPAKKLRTEIDTLSSIFARAAEVTVFTPMDREDQIEEKPHVEYNYYKARYIPGIRYTLPTIQFIRKLYYQIKKADLVHVGSYFYPVCSIALSEAARTGTPSVLTVDSLPGVNWTSGNSFVDIIGRIYTTTFGRATFAAADRIVALGDYLDSPLAAYAGSTTRKVIPNGIDTDYFSPKDSERTDRDTCAAENDNESTMTKLLFVGRLDPVKGLPILFESISILNNCSDTYRLTVVGDGTKRAEYEQQCEDLGISGNVFFEGYQSNVRRYYRENDILVLSSLSEGQPTVLMEAQACGTPVVTTDVGGAATLVGAGDIAPPNDPEALAHVIKNLDHNSPTLCSQARSHIVENYSHAQMVSSYCSLYNQLLDFELTLNL